MFKRNKGVSRITSEVGTLAGDKAKKEAFYDILFCIIYNCVHVDGLPYEKKWS